MVMITIARLVKKKEIAGIVITEITRREQNTVAHRDAVTT